MTPASDELRIDIARAQALADNADARSLPGVTVSHFAKKVPFVGDLIAIGLDIQQQRRIERLEGAILDLQSRLGTQPPPTSLSHDEERLASLFEEWLDRAAKARDAETSDRLNSVFHTALLTGVSADSFDEQWLFLQFASLLTGADIAVLIAVHKSDEAGRIIRLHEVNGEQDALVSAAERLRSIGLLKPIDNLDRNYPNEQKLLEISALGVRFATSLGR